MGPLAIAAAGINAGTSLMQIFKGRKQEKQAQQAINDFEFQELNNVFSSMPVSTMGSDLIREEGQRASAGAIDAARSGGIQGVLSALPNIQSMNNDISRQAALDIDRQVQERDRLIAEDNARIRSMQEQRDRDELAGLGQKLAVGQQNFMSGLNNLGNTLFAASSMGSNSLMDQYQPKAGGI